MLFAFRCFALLGSLPFSIPYLGLTLSLIILHYRWTNIADDCGNVVELWPHRSVKSFSLFYLFYSLGTNQHFEMNRSGNEWLTCSVNTYDSYVFEKSLRIEMNSQLPIIKISKVLHWNSLGSCVENRTYTKKWILFSAVAIKSTFQSTMHAMFYLNVGKEVCHREIP